MKKYVATAQAAPWGSYTRTQKTQTYDAVKAAGENGIGREEICTNTGLPKQRVWFYLSELRRAGLIARMGDAVDMKLLNATDAKLYALVALENAVGAAASEMPFARMPVKQMEQDVMFLQYNRALLRYQKIKALALGAKTKGEESAALKRAVLDLVNLVF